LRGSGRARAGVTFVHTLRPRGSGEADAWAPRLQVEAWRDGDVERLLFVGQGDRVAHAYMLVHDLARNGWAVAKAPLVRCPGSHDRDLLAVGMRTDAACLGDLEAFGVTGPMDWGRMHANLVMAIGSDPTILGDGIRGYGDSILATIGDRTYRNAVGRFAREAHRLGYPEQAPVQLGAEPPQRDAAMILAPGDPSPGRPGITAFVVGGSGDPRDDDPRAILLPVFREASVRMAALHLASASRAVGRANWTPGSYAFYAAGGELGTRRRQATDVYPALAPVIAGDREVARLVDAGRPFEKALADALATTGTRLAPAALRRLRTLPRETPYPGVHVAVAIAGRVPVDGVPADAGAWAPVLRTGQGLLTLCDGLGLDLARLAAGTGWDWQAIAAWMGADERKAEAIPPPLQVLRFLRIEPPPDPGIAQLPADGALDMAQRLSGSLVGNVRRSLGLGMDSAADLVLAGRMLFSGSSLASIDRLQRRWHAGLAAFEAAMPTREAENAWPAAFPPFTASNGLTVRCLVTEGDLRHEGRHDADADGVQGLAHCVGGYGRRCFEGHGHVASVRRDGPDGAVRVSTVEFTPIRGAEGVGSLALAQHRGPGNASPDPEARAAVHELLAAVSAGRHALDEEALRTRDGAAYRDGYDWSDPTRLAAAFDAWRPFLPKAVARRGVAGIAARLHDVPAARVRT
jgi:hypothetical protein